jgi:probable F420-dependent oxidoreductase
MKIGIVFSNVMLFGTPDGARALAEAADETGIESLWTVEHVVVPEGYESPYPYSASGKMPGGETAPIPDPLVWISYVAALTKNVRLATGILILPQRNPVVLAKECATIDVLSGGRLTLGIGIGWLAEEFAAIGVPFKERVARTEEYVGAMRALWSANESYSGDFVTFDKARSNPKPVQSNGIPIVVGGHTKAAARRAGRIGDGFFPGRGDMPALIAECHEAAVEAGRKPNDIEITVGGLPDVDYLKQMEDLGVSRVCVPPPSFDPNDIKRALGELAEKLSPVAAG